MHDYHQHAILCHSTPTWSIALWSKMLRLLTNLAHGLHSATGQEKYKTVVSNKVDSLFLSFLRMVVKLSLFL